MKNKGIVLTIIVVLLLAGLVAYLKFWKSSQNTTSGVQTASSNTPSTLKDLLSGTKSQVCTFKANGSVGKVFVSNGKGRGDFEVPTENGVMKSHMMVDGNMSYVWTDGQNMGIKMSLESNAPVAGQGLNTPQNSAGFDPDTEVNYDCSPWGVDNSVFVLPKEVNFSEFAIPQQDNSKDPPAPNTSTQCSYCSSLTGEEKAACLSALNCN